jgi:hypothetical protein
MGRPAASGQIEDDNMFTSDLTGTYLCESTDTERPSIRKVEDLEGPRAMMSGA